MNWSPVQTYCVWGFEEETGNPRSRGISADSKGRVFASYGISYYQSIPKPMFVVVCCDRGRIVPIPMRGIAKPRSAVISPDGEWLYVRNKHEGIWRLAARETGKWGKPQIVVRPTEDDDEDDEDDDDDEEWWCSNHDLSMQCTDDALWFWSHDHNFMHVPLASGEPRVVYRPSSTDGIKWWVLGEHKMAYGTCGSSALTHSVEVDLVTGAKSPDVAVVVGMELCPVSSAVGPAGTWLGIAPEAADGINALVAFKDGDDEKDVTFLIGGARLGHDKLHDAFSSGEPSTVGNVRHAVVDSEGQLWLMDMRHFDTDDWSEEASTRGVCTIALRCVRPVVPL